ncbi:unnamed protein product [Coccothraustes coccothraustes]
MQLRNSRPHTASPPAQENECKSCSKPATSWCGSAGLTGDPRAASSGSNGAMRFLLLKENSVKGTAVNWGVLQYPSLPRHKRGPRRGRQPPPAQPSRVTPPHGPPPALPTTCSEHGAASDTSDDALHTELPRNGPGKPTAGKQPREHPAEGPAAPRPRPARQWEPPPFWRRGGEAAAAADIPPEHVTDRLPT